MKMLFDIVTMEQLAALHVALKRPENQNERKKEPYIRITEVKTVSGVKLNEVSPFYSVELDVHEKMDCSPKTTFTPLRLVFDALGVFPEAAPADDG